MITALVTKEKMDKWKRYFEKYASSMRPNRKTGREIDEYFRAKYPYQVLDSGEFCAVVEENVMANEYFREKVPPGMRPQIKSYMVGDVYVGIDIESGEFHIECGEIEKAAPIFDDLFLYRGLDENDLKNFVMVGQFLELAEENDSIDIFIKEYKKRGRK